MEKSQTMKMHTRLTVLLLTLFSILALGSANVALAQENPPAKPVDLPCATNASAQVLGMTPVNDGAQILILARIILEAGGGVSDHFHPGTLVVTIESGSFGLTHLGDGEMVVNRAATAEQEATVEPAPHGEQITLAPGDWMVESDMVHAAANLADGQTTLLLSGFIEAGQPLTICADSATPVASIDHH
jgi:hypothetical protein